jgi:hypothetical protein
MGSGVGTPDAPAIGNASSCSAKHRDQYATYPLSQFTLHLFHVEFHVRLPFEITFAVANPAHLHPDPSSVFVELKLVAHFMHLGNPLTGV